MNCIYYELNPYTPLWIYGNNGYNQEMLRFKQLADELVQKYKSEKSHKDFTEKVNQWINDVYLVAKRPEELLDPVLKEI